MNLKFLHSEKTFIIAIAALAMFFNLLPYIYQHQIAPTDKVYIGSFPIPYDKPTYLAEMIQGEVGNWKMIDKYTAEPQQPVFLYPLYLGLGHIARITQISVENIFLISRFFFGIILLFAVLYFIRYFTPEENQRKIAYALALFASGMGWLFRNFKFSEQYPDLGMITDAMPMIRFSYFPHFSVSYILFLGAILLFYHSLKTKNGKFFAGLAGFLAFILSFVMPFTTLFLYFLIATLLIIIFITDKPAFKYNLKNGLIFFVISLPSLIYMYYLGTNDPIWSMVEKQNILPAPPLIKTIIGYGLPLFFSVLGLRALIKKDHLAGWFFSAWIFGAIALAHIPLWIYPMQRRFLETALYIPLAIAAGFGIMAIYNYFKNKYKNKKFFQIKFTYVFLMLTLPFMAGSNYQNWKDFSFWINRTEDHRYYLPEENIEAMKWLSQNTPTDSIILASFANSNIIPYYADRMVYVGHNPMTIDANKKLEIAENFYSGKYSSGEMIEFLKKEKIDYIFYSEEEKISVDGIELDHFNPDDYNFLKKIYQNGNAKIYKFVIIPKTKL